MKIIGAGMAGLIAANYFRKHKPTVFEAQQNLPDNHGALLRFRSDKVFNVIGLKARKVRVRKCIVFGADFMDAPNPYLANMYSYKVTGKVADRSIWNLDTEDRYIAPRDFIAKAAQGCDIEFGHSIAAPEEFRGPIISTIPMPSLMKMLKWNDVPKFEFKPIWTITHEVSGVDVNQTIYFPELEVPHYRASFVGGRLIIELIADPGSTEDAAKIVDQVIDYFGITRYMCDPFTVAVKKQVLGKMLPIDDAIRREFMHWATANFNIYSLGRFATWRPILLDDVVDDLAVIERMMSSSYETMRAK